MKLRYKILNGILGVIALAVFALAITIGYTSSCPAPIATTDDDSSLMSAVSPRCYGGPEVLEVAKTPIPTPAADEVLVLVKNAAVNPLDYHFMRGSPFLLRLMTGIGKPTNSESGRDFAGIVTAIGSEVTNFEVGDEVFGGTDGAFSEYITVRASRAITTKPASISFEQAAAIPIAGVTALQALRDYGQLKPGQKVLINGASGGVGTYAVQFAKSMGAEVYGVCSTRNVEMVLGLGADRVYDYKKENFTEDDIKFDLIVDNVGNHDISDLRGVMTDEGRLVIVGGPKGNWIAPLIPLIKAGITNPFVSQSIETFTARLLPDDMAQIAQWMDEGKARSVIDRRFSLADVSEAVRYSESGRARGKIIIEVQ
ncbi:MAG: NAD(P)-dependent alcohol dehydrogenase [Pseudomonadota bacterium]